jgi:hypothetical protein
MTEINIKKKVRFGRPIHILASTDLLAIQSLVRQHYGKQGGWMITKHPEFSGLFRKYYRIELMRKY